MKDYLKVKARSLETEAKIIREAENKALTDNYVYDLAAQNLRPVLKLVEIDPVSNNPVVKLDHKQMEYTPKQLARFKEKAERARLLYRGLNDHRRVDVRREARSTCLALAFLNGTPYVRAEHVSYGQPNWTKIQRLVEKYAEGDQRFVLQKFAEWKDAALSGQKEQPEGTKARPGSVRQANEWAMRNHASIQEFLEYKNS